MRYYNGIAFRGFVEGVPDGILAGGQYDALMTKMGRRAKAIGFALYPDLLARMLPVTEENSCDSLLLYDKTASLDAIAKAVDFLVEQGLAVKALPAGSKPEGCGKVYELTGNGVKEVLQDA